MEKLYQITLKVKTKTGPLIIETERAYLMKLNQQRLGAVYDRCHALGWDCTAVMISVRDWDNVEKSFTKTVKMDNDF